MVDEILMRCLAKSPADRFQSMGELHTALANAMDRISAPGVATSLARPALVLGTGYRSIYNANLGSAIQTADDTPGPISGELELETPKLRPSLLKFFAAAAVLLLIVGALVASRVEVGGTSAVAEPSYRYTTPVEPAAPRVAPEVPAAPPPVATTEDSVPFPELDELTTDRIAEPKAQAPKKTGTSTKPAPTTAACTNLKCAYRRRMRKAKSASCK
jgi:hypothetical protein